MRVSLVLTLKNEAKTIRPLLESIKKQTLLPTDIVIVDGGSIDDTQQIIQQYCNILPIKLILSPNANIAQGRNTAIEAAENDLIAVTDGGCVLEENWLESITRPFNNPEIDVVSGVYSPLCSNFFEKIVADIIFPDILHIDAEKFLPSSRSVAFRRAVWKKVGGYPESLSTAEDTLFDINLKKIGAKFELSANSIVYWRVRSSFYGLFKQFYSYARGEGEQRLFLLNYTLRYSFILFLFISLFYSILFCPIFILVPIVFPAMFLWFKRLRHLKMGSMKTMVYSILIALFIESGITIGYLCGIFSRRRSNH